MTQQQMQRLRVMSFNIRHGVGSDQRLDLERVARAIERHSATVVGLQEVDRNYGPRSAQEDQAQWLADRLGMHLRFSAAKEREQADGSVGHYGTAILSTLPILGWQRHELPTAARQEPRTVAEIEVAVAGRPVRVMNTHLTLSPSGRIAQAEAIVALVEQRTELPTVLLGDFNTVPGSEPYLRVRRRFFDAWLQAPRGHARGELSREGRTFPAWWPGRRIDFVFLRHVHATAVRVPFTLASDHRPVVADLSVG